jgi:hypothetical protein
LPVADLELSTSSLLDEKFDEIRDRKALNITEERLLRFRVVRPASPEQRMHAAETSKRLAMK